MTPADLVYRQSHIALCIARAQWWAAYANSPANLARRVRVGGYGSTEYLCKSELIDDAMTTAHAHLTNAQEALDNFNDFHSCPRPLNTLA